jgi:hypothetical protein
MLQVSPENRFALALRRSKLAAKLAQRDDALATLYNLAQSPGKSHTLHIVECGPVNEDT